MSKVNPTNQNGKQEGEGKKKRKRCPTCYSGTISDADAATHEHDAFDRVQEVRINAYEERDIRQRSRSHDGDSSLGAGAARAGIRGPCPRPSSDRGGDGLDGGTAVIDALSHRIRVARRKSLHTPEPVGAVDLGVVPRRPDERHRCATVHLDVRWSRERVQAPCGVYLGILGSSVSVHLANRSEERAERVHTSIVRSKRREVVYCYNEVPTRWQWHHHVPGVTYGEKERAKESSDAYRITIEPDVVH